MCCHYNNRHDIMKISTKYALIYIIIAKLNNNENMMLQDKRHFASAYVS